MNSFPIHKLTLVSCIISFICFIAFSSHSHVHAVTPACIVTSNVFDLTGTLTSTGTGPLVYSQTLTGYEYTGTGTSPSSIVSFNISAHNTATIAADQGITVSQLVNKRCLPSITSKTHTSPIRSVSVNTAVHIDSYEDAKIALMIDPHLIPIHVKAPAPAPGSASASISAAIEPHHDMIHKKINMIVPSTSLLHQRNLSIFDSNLQRQIKELHTMEFPTRL